MGSAIPVRARLRPPRRVAEKPRCRSRETIHTLRKEAGSILTKAGIHAASQFLRHADIQVTDALRRP
jgi:integrase